MNALHVYVSVAHLLIEAEYGVVRKAQLLELNRKFHELRKLLTCVVCLNLVIDPFKPTTGRCQHNVCRLCVRGRKQLQPECGNCNDRCDFKTYTENRKQSCLMLCYKSLCIKLRRSGLYFNVIGLRPPISDDDEDDGFGGLQMAQTLQDIILEGARYDDMWNKFTDELPLPFRLQKKVSENDLITKVTESDFTLMSMYENTVESEDIDIHETEYDMDEPVEEEEIIEELTEYTPDELHDMDFELIDEEEVESAIMPTATISTMVEAVPSVVCTPTTYEPMHEMAAMAPSFMPVEPEAVVVEEVTITQEQSQSQSQSATMTSVCEAQAEQPTSLLDVVNLPETMPVEHMNNLPSTPTTVVISSSNVAAHDDTNEPSCKPRVNAPVGAIATMNTCDMPFIKRHLRIMPTATTAQVQATEMPVAAAPVPATTATLMPNNNSCTVITSTAAMADIVTTDVPQPDSCDKSTLMLTPNVQVLNTGVQTNFAAPLEIKLITSDARQDIKRRRDSDSSLDGSDHEQVETNTAVSSTPRTRFRSKALKLDEAKSLAVVTAEEIQLPEKSCDSTQEAASEMAIPTNKRKCRCGLTSTRTNSTCFRRRCFCYRNNLPCTDCGCKGCCNPFRPDGTRVSSISNSNSTSPIFSHVIRQPLQFTTQSAPGLSLTTAPATSNQVPVENITTIGHFPGNEPFSPYPKVCVEKENGNHIFAHLFTDRGEAVRPEELGLPLLDVQVTIDGVHSTVKTFVVPLGTTHIPLLNHRTYNFVGAMNARIVTAAANDDNNRNATATITNTEMRTTPQTRHTAKKMQMLKMNQANTGPVVPTAALPLEQNNQVNVQLPATPEKDEHDVQMLTHDAVDLDLLQSVGFVNFI